MTTRLVVKEMTFDAAHILPGYDGQCKNLHGHTYKVQVGVMSDTIQEDGPDKGMVVDFNKLKEHMTQVINRLDHALILGEVATPEETALFQWVEEFGMKHVTLGFRSTVENIAYYILKEMGIQRGYCRLYETPTSYCEVYAG